MTDRNDAPRTDPPTTRYLSRRALEVIHLRADEAEFEPDTKWCSLVLLYLCRDLTILAPIAEFAREGHEFAFYIVQDAVGGHVVEFDPAYRLAYVQTMTPGAIDYVSFVTVDSKIWLQRAASTDLRQPPQPRS